MVYIYFVILLIIIHYIYRQQFPLHMPEVSLVRNVHVNGRVHICECYARLCLIQAEGAVYGLL